MYSISGRHFNTRYWKLKGVASDFRTSKMECFDWKRNAHFVWMTHEHHDLVHHCHHVTKMGMEHPDETIRTHCLKGLHDWCNNLAARILARSTVYRSFNASPCAISTIMNRPTIFTHPTQLVIHKHLMMLVGIIDHLSHRRITPWVCGTALWLWCVGSDDETMHETVEMY